MTIIGGLCAALGLVLYLAAFAQGPGPTMGDKPVQAATYSLATVLLIAGFALLVVF